MSVYLVGQLITSALFAAFALVTCLALGVPQSMLLAQLALTESPATAGIVGALIALPIAAAIPVVERIWREEQPPAPDPAEVGLAPPPWKANGTAPASTDAVDPGTTA